MVIATPITELISAQQAELGRKWLDSIKNPKKIEKMVDMIADHIAEAMKMAYQQGMSDQRQLLIFNDRK